MHIQLQVGYRAEDFVSTSSLELLERPRHLPDVGQRHKQVGVVEVQFQLNNAYLLLLCGGFEGTPNLLLNISFEDNLPAFSAEPEVEISLQ
jgi:hypothetical protein